MKIPHGFAAVALAGLATIGLAGTAPAQDYPNQSITWVVPSSPGSGFDVVARIISPRMSEILGQSVVVENVAGAGGTIGAAEVAAAKPDGYTILQININHTSAEALHKDLSYSLLESFDPVVRFTTAYYVFVTSPRIEAETLADVIAMAKEKPGELNLASAGIGSSTFMVGQSFLAAAGIEMTHIPYEGGGPAIASLVAGETDFYGAPYAIAKPFIDDGKIRALAMTSTERVPFLPDVPTAAETVPGYEFTSWYGLVVPAGTPAEVKEKIRAALVETLADPKVEEQLASVGMDTSWQGPEEFAVSLKAEIDLLTKLVEDTGIEAK